MCEMWGCCQAPWCRRGEAVRKRGGGGELLDSRSWYGKTLALVLGQIGGFSTTIRKYYYGCRLYMYI